MAQIKNIKKPGEQIRGADVGFAGLDKNGNVIGTGITEDDLFELPEGAQTGDVLAWGGETGAEWRPHYPADGSEGDVLKLGETGPEWAADPAELPAIESGDAGKVLAVNAGETGVEWVSPGGGGSDIFRHDIKISISGTALLSFSIFTDNNESINTLAKLVTYLASNGYTSNTTIIPASGKVIVSTVVYSVVGIFRTSTNIDILYVKDDMTQGTYSTGSSVSLNEKIIKI